MTILNQPQDVQQDAFEKTEVFKNFQKLSSFADATNFLAFNLKATDGPIYTLSCNPSYRLTKGKKPRSCEFYSIAGKHPQVTKTVNGYQNPHDTSEALLAAALFNMNSEPNLNKSIMLTAATEMIKCALALISRRTNIKEWTKAINESENVRGISQVYEATTAISSLGNILNSIMDDRKYDSEHGMTNAVKTLADVLSNKESTEYTDADRKDCADMYNLLMAGILNFTQHPATLDLNVMADEAKQTLTHAAGTEIDSQERNIDA